MADNEVDKVELIKKLVKENSQGLTEEELKREEEAMLKIFFEGSFPADALGFSKEFLDEVYHYAYNLFQQNKIEEASQLFRWLKKMVPVEPIYTIALIHCLTLQKKWLGAISYLLELAYLDVEDPVPFEKISECLIELGDLSGALITIDKAIERAGDKKEFAEAKGKWQLRYDNILSQLNIDPAIIAKVNAEYENKKIG